MMTVATVTIAARAMATMMMLGSFSNVSISARGKM